MKKETKIKACEIYFNSMTGLSFRNITFHDFDNKVFTIGRERNKKQYKTLDEKVFIKGHLDEKDLNDRKYLHTDECTKQRQFPPSLDDLKRDLKLWEEIKGLEKLIDYDIESIILDAINKY
jgi:hypothetical protein